MREILYRFTPLRADALLLGGAVALMLRGPEIVRLTRLTRPALLLVAGGFSLFELLYYHATHHAWTIFYRLLTMKALRRLGQVSYGFYVFHDIPHRAYAALVVSVVGHESRHLATWIGLTGLAGTLTLSFLSFRYFESPFLRLKARYAPG